MAPISPYLDHLLSRWNSKGESLRKDAGFQEELLEPVAIATHGHYLAMRERRRQDLEALEQTFRESLLRWEERLRRIEMWKKAVGHLQQEHGQLQALVRSSAWLQKARGYQERFISRLQRHAKRLDQRQQALHETLTVWLSALQEREASLQELIEKQERSERTVYVSRSRKQPEVDFVTEQQSASDQVGAELRQLRRSLHHVQGRFEKALRVIERQTAGSEILYEIHKQEILGGLKELETVLKERREAILSDALTYEACRHLLRRLQETAHKLRCIEDLPHASNHGWKRLLQFR